MTDQAAGERKKSQSDAQVSDNECKNGGVQPVTAASVLTMSRGTRPLSLSHLVKGDLHSARRRSA
jgi:hypothetical protein